MNPLPASSDLDSRPDDDPPSDVVASRDELDVVQKRKEVWKFRRMTLGFVATFLISLYFAWDGTNENAALRAAFLVVPAVGFLIAQVVFEVQHRREVRERLEEEPDVTGRITDDVIGDA